MHGRVTRNNTPGLIPTSEGAGKRSRAEESDWILTDAEQEQVNEYNWSRVPTYEGGRRSKRLATSEGGAKHEPPEEDINMYDCFSDDDKEDEEMEPEPTETKGCPLIQKITQDIRNEAKQARNESQKVPE